MSENPIIKHKIKKKIKTVIIFSLILTTIGIVYFQINNYNTVRAGGNIKEMRMEKFWSGNRFYLTLERDNDNGAREYEISEKDYYKLGKGYIVVFMDGHIETLEEFKEKKETGKVPEENRKESEQYIENFLETTRTSLYPIILICVIIFLSIGIPALIYDIVKQHKKMKTQKTIKKSVKNEK